MARTTSEAVEDILGDNYDDSSSLTRYITTANVIVTRVSACATERGYTLSSDELELMEMWLAAHFYTIMDPIYKRKKTERAEGEFYDWRSYLEAAKALDPSGCLAAIMAKKVALHWGGLPKSEQTDAEDRD